MSKHWWQGAVAYQIYPRSFKDSNGDGIGDLRGIIEKLDYLADLGITMIWLCPVFASPMADNGYDISDYRAVNSEFGTMADMEELIREADKRGIKILLDLVLNHTSNQHPWFLSALADQKSKYRDYYIFRKPNNWRSIFGGPAWERAGTTGEYYLHLFAKEQPDLNWENPAMRKELYDMIHWWMDKGVAGFRIDAICQIKKDQSYRDLSPDAADGLADSSPCARNQKGLGFFLAEMRDAVFKPRNAFTVAEAYGIPPPELPDYIGENGFFSCVFDFSYTDVEQGVWHRRIRLKPYELRNMIFEVEKHVGAAGHGAPYFENHDQNRSPNRYLLPHQRTYEGKTTLAFLFFFLQGIPFIYQGQELGMMNYPWKHLDEFNDPATVDQYHRAILAGKTEEEAMEIAAYRSRDNARIPFSWNALDNAGFSSVKPWLPVNPDYKEINAEAQQGKSNTVLGVYKEMIRLRKEHSDLFCDGKLIPRFPENKTIIAYERKNEKERALVVCNFSDTGGTLNLKEGGIRDSVIWLSNSGKKGTRIQETITLTAFESLVLGVNSKEE
jgi:alpha-glucosidase